MSRPLRIEYAGAWYHVMNRGLARMDIFKKPKHFYKFCELLEEASKLFSIECHAYCLMSNHYHLLIHTPLGNLARAMRHINGVYTQSFNHDTKRDGALFRGRYKAILVEKDSYLSQVSRYIHLNPVTAKIVKCPEDYKWSSYSYYLNPRNKPEWLHVNAVLAQMNSHTPTLDYRNFVTTEVNQSVDAFYAEQNHGIILGLNPFKEECLERVKSSSLDASRYELRCSKNIPSLKEIFEVIAEYYSVDLDSVKQSKRATLNHPRKMAIFMARDFGYCLKEIVMAITQISPNGVSAAICYYKKSIDLKAFAELKLMISKR
jgi:putative transposase